MYDLSENLKNVLQVSMYMYTSITYTVLVCHPINSELLYIYFKHFYITAGGRQAYECALIGSILWPSGEGSYDKSLVPQCTAVLSQK